MSNVALLNRLAPARQQRVLAERQVANWKESVDAQPRAISPASYSLLALVKSDIFAKATWCYQSNRWGALLKTLLTDGTTAMCQKKLPMVRMRMAPAKNGKQD